MQKLYETDDIAVQQHLVQIPIVDMLITRFGRPVFIDEILPYLLNMAKKRDYPLHDLLNATLTKITYVTSILALTSTNVSTATYSAFRYQLNTLCIPCLPVCRSPTRNMWPPPSHQWVRRYFELWPDSNVLFS